MNAVTVFMIVAGVAFLLVPTLAVIGYKIIEMGDRENGN